MSDARNHHYVPQCYLKGFAKLRSKTAKLKAYDIGRGKIFSSIPRTIAAKRDYNRVEIDGVDPNFIESAWGSVESKFDQALARVIHSRSIIDDNDWHWILALLSRIITSNPDFRQVRGKFIEDIAGKVLNLALASEERWNAAIGEASIEAPVPYEKMKSAVSEKRIFPKASKEKLVQDEAELWPKILDILLQRNWTLVKAHPGEGHFATSDRPFSLRFNDAKVGNGFHRPGLGLKNTTLIFPISKSLAAVGQFEDVIPEDTAMREQIAVLNYDILMSAGEQVYCSEEFPVIDLDFEIRDFGKSQLWKEICAASRKST